MAKAWGAGGMRVLLVEDDRQMVEVLTDALADSSIQIHHVESREGAFQALENEAPFDLAICDLKIPPSDTARDTDLTHGLAVCDRLGEVASGTPVVVFSGFGTLEVLGKRLARAPNEDVVGTDARPMLDHVSKGKLDEFLDQVLGLAEEIERLDREIEITWGGLPVDLSRAERRALLIFARRRSGVLIRAQMLPGGRSDARTLRLDVEGSGGDLVGRVLAKLNSLEGLEDEKTRYEQFVSPFLPAGRFAPLVEDVRAGARDRGLAVYSLAGGAYSVNLFQRLADSAADAAHVVDGLKTTTSVWVAAKQPETTTVGAVRRDLISDGAFAAERPRLGTAPVEEVEQREIYVFRCPAHGDLHGGNALVDDQNNALLIDYGRVGPSVAALDPVTLELSAVLHPDAGLELGGWPTLDQAQAWFSLEVYTEGCPISEFVGRCRRWAHEVARGDREVLATAYAYAARQLKFPTVNQELAVAYAQGVLDRLAL